MKSTWLYVAAIAAAALIAAAAFLFMPLAGPPKPELDQSRSKATAKNLFVAEIAPEKPEIKQGELHSWILTVKTSDGKPVEDARVEIGGGMPDHNHGLPTSPEVTEYLGQGRYRVEGVKFTMSGWWELRFDISSAAGTDAVVFNLVL